MELSPMKICLFGDSGAGKTSIFNRLSIGQFQEYVKSTIKTDYNEIKATLGEETISYLLYDTAGQEQFKSMTKSYLVGSSAIFLVFDFSDPEALELVNSNLDFIENAGIDDNQVLLIGNKSDLPAAYEMRKINQYVEKHKFHSFTLLSAKTGEGFEYLNEKIFQIEPKKVERFVLEEQSRKSEVKKMISCCK